MGRKKEVTNEMLLDVLVKMDECLSNVEMNMATKEDLKNQKEEIFEVLKPTEKALDKDTVTLVDHGRRIARIEKHLSLN